MNEVPKPMNLKYQQKLESIENCPLDNLQGEITLFRCVENPMNATSFIPNAVLLKPKFEDNCLAWGLSLYKTYDSAKQTLDNLSRKKKGNYTNIAQGVITDNDGIKHGCKKNSKHYTFYPLESIDIVSKFAIIDDNENK